MTHRKCVWNVAIIEKTVRIDWWILKTIYERAKVDRFRICLSWRRIYSFQLDCSFRVDCVTPENETQSGGGNTFPDGAATALEFERSIGLLQAQDTVPLKYQIAVSRHFFFKFSSFAQVVILCKWNRLATLQSKFFDLYLTFFFARGLPNVEIYFQSPLCPGQSHDLGSADSETRLQAIGGTQDQWQRSPCDTFGNPSDGSSPCVTF